MRKELGLTQADLAEELAKRTKTRTNKNQVSQWETSRVPGPQDATLKAIAGILGVSAVWLATGDGPRDGGGGREDDGVAVDEHRSCLCTYDQDFAGSGPFVGLLSYIERWLGRGGAGVTNHSARADGVDSPSKGSDI